MLEIKKKLGRSTDGGGSGLKFFRIFYFNMEPRLYTRVLLLLKCNWRMDWNIQTELALRYKMLISNAWIME